METDHGHEGDPARILAVSRRPEDRADEIYFIRMSVNDAGLHEKPYVAIEQR